MKISILKSMISACNEIKQHNCFVNSIVVYDADKNIPDQACTIFGGEELDSIAIKEKKKRIKVIYMKEEYKEYAITSFSTTLDANENILNVSFNTIKDVEPIRSLIILKYRPKSNNFAKCIGKIAPEHWLIGLTDNSKEILESLIQKNDESIESELD